MQLISQQRAAFALQQVRGVQQQSPEEQKQFRTVANSIAVQIQRTGLGQTLAFALSKQDKADGKGWKAFYQLLSDWLQRPQAVYPAADGGSGTSLMDALMNGDMLRYQQAQAEALALLVWVRKFARAMLAGDENTPESPADTAAIQ